MEKKRTYRFVSFLVMVIIFWSCSKIERTNRKFMKDGPWTFTELTIGGDANENLSTWYINSCGTTDGFCPGSWMHSNGSTAEFFWDFDNYNGNLIFQLSDDVQFDSNKASLQCFNLQGEYEILSSSSKAFELQTNSANGYPQTTVYIKMEAE